MHQEIICNEFWLQDLIKVFLLFLNNIYIFKLGIGLAIIEALLQRGDVHAIMCCRELSRGEEARQELLLKNPDYNSRLELSLLNVIYIYLILFIFIFC